MRIYRSWLLFQGEIFNLLYLNCRGELLCLDNYPIENYRLVEGPQNLSHIFYNAADTASLLTDVKMSVQASLSFRKSVTVNFGICRRLILENYFYAVIGKLKADAILYIPLDSRV